MRRLTYEGIKTYKQPGPIEATTLVHAAGTEPMGVPPPQ